MSWGAQLTEGGGGVTPKQALHYGYGYCYRYAHCHGAPGPMHAVQPTSRRSPRTEITEPTEEFSPNESEPPGGVPGSLPGGETGGELGGEAGGVAGGEAGGVPGVSPGAEQAGRLTDSEGRGASGASSHHRLPGRGSPESAPVTPSTACRLRGYRGQPDRPDQDDRETKTETERQAVGLRRRAKVPSARWST